MKQPDKEISPREKFLVVFGMAIFCWIVIGLAAVIVIRSIQ